MPLTLPIAATTLPSSLECVLTNAHWQALIATLSVTFGVELSFINIGNEEPAPANRIWPWLRTNPDGSPDKLYQYFAGYWVSRHPSPPGSTILYRGTEASIYTFDGGEGTAATAVTPNSGPMWQPVSQLVGRMPIQPGLIPGGGTTTLAPGDTGGEEKHVLTLAEMPTHDHGIPTNSRLVRQQPQTLAVGAGVEYGLSQFEEQGEDEGHNNMPPYYAIWFIERSSRVHYRL